MKPRVILNPYAGRWSAQERRQEAELALQAVGIDFDLVATSGPGHGSQLAAQAVQDGCSLVISAGGDGSVSEVVNGLLEGWQPGKELPTLGILPLGTANDLVANLGLPADLPGAARVIAAGKSRCMDVGKVSFAEDSGGEAGMRSRYFDNNSAIGLEPTVTLIQQRNTWLKGTIRYLLSAVMAVMQRPVWQARVEWEGGHYEGPISLVTVGNGRVTGGFYMTPHANPYDGKLTFVYAYVAGRLEMLSILPKAMKPGKGNYVEHPAVHELESPWIRITTQRPTPVHADGEIQSTTVTRIEYQVLPGVLPVLVP